MSRRILVLSVLTAALASACGRAGADSSAASAQAAAVTVAAIDVVEQPIKRFIRVSGTLTAQEQADVAAEVAGRVVATPVERGSRVGASDTLIRLLASEGEAQAIEAQAELDAFEEPICFIGHSHYPGTFDRYDSHVRYTRHPEIRLEKGHRYLVNVGSVGQPRDNDPRACYAILTDEAIIFRRIEYPCTFPYKGEGYLRVRILAFCQTSTLTLKRYLRVLEGLSRSSLFTILLHQ